MEGKHDQKGQDIEGISWEDEIVDFWCSDQFWYEPTIWNIFTLPGGVIQQWDVLQAMETVQLSKH